MTVLPEDGPEFLRRRCCTDQHPKTAHGDARCKSGVVYPGNDDNWRKISDGETGSYRSMTSYPEAVWCQSDTGVWRIDGDRISRVEFPDDILAQAGVMAARDGILLVAGKTGAAYFDGEIWREFLNFK